MADEIQDIRDTLKAMNERDLKDAEKRGQTNEAILAIKEDVAEIRKLAHPVGCAVAVHAEETAQNALKAAARAQKAVDGIRSGKGMTGREKVGIAGIGTVILGLIEAAFRWFGR